MKGALSCGFLAILATAPTARPFVISSGGGGRGASSCAEGRSTRSSSSTAPQHVCCPASASSSTNSRRSIHSSRSSSSSISRHNNLRRRPAQPLLMGRGDSPFRPEDESKRMARVAQVVQGELSDIILAGHPVKTTKHLSDDIRSKISIVDVVMSPDLRHARVMVSVYGDPREKRQAYAWMVKNGRRIRSALARSLRGMKGVPTLHFQQYDVSAAVDMSGLIEMTRATGGMGGGASKQVIGGMEFVDADDDDGLVEFDEYASSIEEEYDQDAEFDSEAFDAMFASAAAGRSDDDDDEDDDMQSKAGKKRRQQGGGGEEEEDDDDVDEEGLEIGDEELYDEAEEEAFYNSLQMGEGEGEGANETLLARRLVAEIAELEAAFGSREEEEEARKRYMASTDEDEYPVEYQENDEYYMDYEVYGEDEEGGYGGEEEEDEEDEEEGFDIVGDFFDDEDEEEGEGGGGGGEGDDDDDDDDDEDDGDEEFMKKYRITPLI